MGYVIGLSHLGYKWDINSRSKSMSILSISLF